MFENAAAQPARTAALAIATLAAATLAGAWMFQFVFGIQPCPLCLEQRYAYYFAVPLACAGGCSARRSAPRARCWWRRFAVIAGSACSGMPGSAPIMPASNGNCGPGRRIARAPLTDLGAAGGLLKKIKTIRVVRCDEMPWSFLGISLAGYNVLISLALSLSRLGRAGRVSHDAANRTRALSTPLILRSRRRRRLEGCRP